MPLALASAVRYSQRELRATTVKQLPAGSLRAWPPSRVLPNRHSPRGRSRRLLPWTSVPYSTYKRSRSTCRGLCLPATFRLQGLVTLVTVSSRERRAGFVSRRQRSWDSAFGAFSSRQVSHAFPRGMDPHTVPLSGCLRFAAPGSGKPRSLGFDPAGSPSPTDMGLARRPAGCSLGVRPFQGSSVKACVERLPDAPLTRFGPLPRDSSKRLRVSQPRPSHSQPTTSAGVATATLLGFPCQYDPKHSGGRPGGLCVHLTPRPSHC
jgi:hypothetical protein